MNEEKLTMDYIVTVIPPLFEGSNEIEITSYFAKVIKNPKRPLGWKRYDDTSNHFYNFTRWAIHEGEILLELETVISSLLMKRRRNPNQHITFLFCDYFSPCAIQIYLACQEHKELKNKEFVHFIGVLHGASFVKGDLFSKINNSLFILGKPLDTFLLKLYDEIWCPSKHFYESLPKSYRGRKIFFPLPFDSDKEYFLRARRRKKRDIDFVYVGRLTKDRNPKDLIFIVEKLVERDKKILVITKGDLTKSSKKLIEIRKKVGEKRLKIINQILSEEELAENLSKCKVAISTAKQEGFGYGLLKAIACGCVPCVPFDVVYKDIIDKDLTFKDKEEGVKKALEILSKYKELRKTITPFNTILDPNSILISQGRTYINTGKLKNLNNENWTDFLLFTREIYPKPHWLRSWINLFVKSKN